MTQRSDSIIGKTVTGVIARERPDGQPTLIMLQFSDGSCCEFVSPRWQRRLTRPTSRHNETMPDQLCLMPAA
jgi:hypothetical protein